MDTRQANTAFSTYYDEHFKELRCKVGEELRWVMIHKALMNYYHDTLPQDLTILDFGCGTGWLSNKLNKFGKVTGIDFSGESITDAKKQFPGIDFRTIDITSTDINALGKESFDLIVSSEVIEHISDHKLVVHQLSLLLKNGGVLLLTTPNGQWYNNYFTTNLLQYKQPIENWTTGKKLQALLEQQFAGITIKTFYVKWIYSSKKSILLKILANNYLRAALIKAGLFNSYLSLLESFGCGLYLLVSAKKQNYIR